MIDPADVPATRGAALAVADAAYLQLAELGETIEDEWSYVTALVTAGRRRMGAAAGADRGAAVSPEAGLAVATAAAEIARIRDPHRAIDWLSTFPAVVELAIGPGTPWTPPDVRFQDAAKDARAAVYAAIQADPLVDRVAGLLAAATYGQRLMARAVMNGESDDPATWQAMFPAAFGADARAGSDALLAAALEVAARGDEVRNQVRGAIVEALAERLVARRTGAARRERRVLFDGVPAEIHPYDLTVEAPGREEAWDCKWGARGINADVLNQLDDARRHAAAEERRIRVGLIVFDLRTSCAVRLAGLTAPKAGTLVITLEGLDALGGTTAR